MQEHGSSKACWRMAACTCYCLERGQQGAQYSADGRCHSSLRWALHAIQSLFWHNSTTPDPLATSPKLSDVRITRPGSVRDQSGHAAFQHEAWEQRGQTGPGRVIRTSLSFGDVTSGSGVVELCQNKLWMACRVHRSDEWHPSHNPCLEANQQRLEMDATRRSGGLCTQSKACSGIIRPRPIHWSRRRSSMTYG